ncbi:MAG: hypothetical protein WCK42_10185, partial [Myxococcaceae bacterium]
MKLSRKAFLCLLLILQACEVCKIADDEKAIQCLNNMPRRDLASHPQVQDYLKNHKVYVSFSTSPKNLSKLLPMLRTLDLELVEKIYLALPEKYRNTQEYGPIPPEILNFTKLEIIARDQKDLGPIMKMLPAIEKVAALDPYALVISIDDDTGFPKGMVNELIYYSVLYPNAII